MVQASRVVRLPMPFQELNSGIEIRYGKADMINMSGGYDSLRHNISPLLSY